MTPRKTFAMIAGATAVGICLFCGGCLGVSALMQNRYERGKERSLARGLGKGLRPLVEGDAKGTPVYRWSPEDPTAPPKPIGEYAGSRVAHGDEISAAAQDRSGKVTYFDLPNDQYAYWVDQR